MNRPPRLLLLASGDAPRLYLSLQEGGVTPAAVVSGGALEAALRDEVWDAVVASASAAEPAAVLAAVRAAQPGVPVVVVAGEGCDPVSLAAAGAHAVVAASDAHLVGGAVSRALRASSTTAPALWDALSPDAGAVQALAEHLPIGLYQSTPDGRVLFANEALALALGCASVAALSRLDVRSDLGYPRELFVEEVRRHGEVRNLVVRWTDPTGRLKYTRENARAVRDGAGRVLYYEGTMEDVTAEHEARERERRRVEQLGAIVRFATAVDGADTVEEVYRGAVEAVAASMGTPYALLLTWRGDETRCVAWSEALPASALALFEDLHLGALLPLHTHPVLLRDEPASGRALPEEVRAMMHAHGVRSIGSFPLVHHGRPQGAFVVLYEAPDALSDEEQRVAETLAWHIAGSLARQRAESSLRDSETCLRFIAENTAHVLYRLRYGEGEGLGGFDYLSPAVEGLTGYAPDELAALGGLGALIEEWEVTQGDGLVPGADALLPGAGGHTGERAGEHPYVALYRMRAKGGGAVWVENNAYPWRDAAGQPVGLVGMLQDVTERKRREDEQAAEAARTLSQQKALVELAGLHAVGPGAVIRRATELAAECTGAARVSVWAEDAACGAVRCVDLYARPDDTHGEEPPLPREAVEAILAALGENRVVLVEDVEHHALLGRSGAAEVLKTYLHDRGVRALLIAPVRRSGRVTGVVVFSHTGEPYAWSAAEQDFAAAVADVIALAYERDERRAAEEARQESEARYRALSELASDYAFAVHFDERGQGHLAWATEAFGRVSGYVPAEVPRIEDLFALVHPESREAALDALRRLGEGEDVALELRIVTKAGEDRWVCHRARRVLREETGAVVLYHSGQDVTERKAFERELIAAREAAEEVARLKSAFLANMSHEIRTPLTGILGYAELLAEEVDGEHREFAEFIEKSGRRLLDTLNSVLELARLEASGVEPCLELLDVAAEAQQAIRLLAPLAEAKGLALTLDAPEGHASTYLDRVCLSRILTNLIGNAIKFTDEGGVHVGVGVDGGALHLRVRDTGRGIAAAFLPYLFDEFKQESEGHARSHEGAGLGLAITKRLTDLLGGAISVESARPGGTTITVTFPHHAPPASGDGASTLPPSELLLVQPGEGMTALPVEPEETPEAPRAPLLTGEAPLAEEEGVEPTGARGADAPASGMALDEAPGTSAMAGDPAPSFVDGLLVEAAPPASLDPFDFILVPPIPLVPESGPPEAGASPTPAETECQEAPEPTPEPAVPEDRLPPEHEPEPLAEPLPFVAVNDAVALPDPEPGLDALPAVSLVPPATGSPEPPPAPEDAAPPVLAGPSVLVVEDNEDTRMLLGRLLQRDYRVCAVGDALSALDRMSRERFDALVLDINLGGKQTGMDVLRVARTLPGYDRVFAVALTAYALPGDRERFLRAGFNRYVSKPFTRASLMAALTEGAPVRDYVTA